MLNIFFDSFFNYINVIKNMGIEDSLFRKNRYEGFDSKQYLNLIKQFSNKNITIDLNYTEPYVNSNCYWYMLDKYDDDELTKGKITCIPLKILRSIYKTECKEKNLKIDKTNTFKEKQDIFTYLTQNGILSLSSPIKLLKKIKYFFKPYSDIFKCKFPDSNTYITFRDDLIEPEEFKQYISDKGKLNFYNEDKDLNLNTIPLRTHDFGCITANIVKTNDCFFCKFSTNLVDDIKGIKYNLDIVLKNQLKHLCKEYSEGFVPILYAQHWICVYFNLKYKYFTIYDSQSGLGMKTYLKNNIYYYFHNIGFVKIDSNDFEIESDHEMACVQITEWFAEFLKTYEKDIKIIFNRTINQEFSGTCGLYVILFIHLMERGNKKRSIKWLKNVFYTLSLIPDSLAISLISIFVSPQPKTLSSLVNIPYNTD